MHQNLCEEIPSVTAPLYYTVMSCLDDERKLVVFLVKETTGSRAKQILQAVGFGFKKTETPRWRVSLVLVCKMLL